MVLQGVVCVYCFPLSAVCLCAIKVWEGISCQVRRGPIECSDGVCVCKDTGREHGAQDFHFKFF